MLRSPRSPASLTPDDEGVLAAGYQLADDRRTGYLTGEQQPAGRLRVGEQQRGQLVDGVEVGVRPHPGQVPSGAAADVAGAGGVDGAVEVRHGGRVDDRGDAAGPGQLVR